MSERVPIQKSPEPKYDEKRVLSDLAETPSGEWQVPPPVAHAIKVLLARAEDAEKKLKRRNSTRLAAVVCGVLGIGGGGAGTWGAHDRVRVLEREVKSLSTRLNNHRVSLVKCSCEDPGEDEGRE